MPYPKNFLLDLSCFLFSLGSFCVEGSANPEKCPPGQSQLNIGQDECIPCRKGYYCPIGATVPDPVICPAYSYCPEGSYEPTRCPNGTYTRNTTEGLESVSQCKDCVPGSYCRCVSCVLVCLVFPDAQRVFEMSEFFSAILLIKRFLSGPLSV